MKRKALVVPLRECHLKWTRGAGRARVIQPMLMYFLYTTFKIIQSIVCFHTLLRGAPPWNEVDGSKNVGHAIQKAFTFG